MNSNSAGSLRISTKNDRTSLTVDISHLNAYSAGRNGPDKINTVSVSMTRAQTVKAICSLLKALGDEARIYLVRGAA